MKHRITSDIGSSRLLIIFAGWAMDPHPFEHLVCPGYDIMVIWDYRSFFFDWQCVEEYEEICILAWSFGVFAASQSAQAIDPKITKRVALNGTLHPISDQYGIPVNIFDGTIEHLDDRNLAKFYRRMCNSSEDFKAFSDHRPQRSLPDVLDELNAIEARTILCAPACEHWDLAIIGRDDRIFPALNQIKAWEAQQNTFTQVIDAGHFSDFQKILNGLFVDKSTMINRFSNVPDYDQHSIVQRDILNRLITKIRATHLVPLLKKCKGEILEIGSGSGLLSRKIVQLAPRARLSLWDIASTPPENLPYSVFKHCDAEQALRNTPEESYDFIFSSSTIQWFNSPALFVQSCAKALRPGGYAIISTFAKGNLQEISDITGFALPLIDKRQWQQLLEQHFAVRSIYSFRRRLFFDSPKQILEHLRATGVNSLGGSDPLKSARALLRDYPTLPDGRCTLTYAPLIFIIKKL